jgi:hypothetical protein
LFSQATVSSFLSHSPRRHQSLALWHVRLRPRHAFYTSTNHKKKKKNIKKQQSKKKKLTCPRRTFLRFCGKFFDMTTLAYYDFVNAIERCDAFKARKLIANRHVDVNARLPAVDSPPALVLAARLGHKELVQAFLDAGARMDGADCRQMTACHAAHGQEPRGHAGGAARAQAEAQSVSRGEP